MTSNIFRVNRRDILKFTAAGTALPLATMFPRLARAADPIKTAAIYTVPVEQQWVGSSAEY